MKIEVLNVVAIEDLESKRKAYVNVIIDDSIFINDIVVIEGKCGLFATMPQRKVDNLGEKSTFCFVSRENRIQFNSIVLAAYKEQIYSKI